MTADPAAWFHVGFALAAGVTGFALGAGATAAVSWLIWQVATDAYQRATWRLKARRLSRAAQASGREPERRAPAHDPVSASWGQIDPAPPVLNGSERIRRG